MVSEGDPDSIIVRRDVQNSVKRTTRPGRTAFSSLACYPDSIEGSRYRKNGKKMEKTSQIGTSRTLSLNRGRYSEVKSAMRLFIDNASAPEIEASMELLIWRVCPKGGATVIDDSHQYGIVVVDDADVSEAIKVFRRAGIWAIPERPTETFA